jgi:hypothetical protein
MSLENIIIPSAIALVVGIVLLFLEYRTSWFQKNFTKKLDSDDDFKIGKELGDSQGEILGLTGISITPINQLGNHIGD